MVSTTIYNKLSSDEQNEFRGYSSKFIRAVQNSGAIDGFDFAKYYQIRNAGDTWFITHVDSCEPFAGITSNSEAVIKALLSDAGQNYGR